MNFSPAQVDTPIFSRAVRRSDKQLDQMWKAVAEGYPLRRKGHPEDIANAIIFFSSNESDWITGVNLKIDGGYVDSQQLIWE